MITPDKFAETPVYDLLTEAAAGRAGMDHRWLNAILDRPEEASADLVRFASEDHVLDPISLDEDLLMLFRRLRTPEAIPFFVDLLKREPDDVPDGLVDALFAVRQEALEPLLAIYEETPEDESGEIAFALAAFRLHDDRVLRILLDRLEYDAGDGALCLGLYGDPAARPALEKMLAEVDDEHLQQDITDAIGQLGRETDETAGEFNIYEYYLEKAMPETSVLTEEELVGMLESGDPEYRLAAADGFVNREISGEAVARLLERAQTDNDEHVRGRCWQALAGEAGENQVIYDAMLARLQDESASKVERAGALTGLGQKADEEAIRPWAELFYNDPETRAAAMSAMWNSLDRSYARYFPEHLNDPDPAIRKQAITGIGYLNISDSAEKLRDYFQDDEYRQNALFAYALAARTEVSPGRMRPLLARIDEFAGGLNDEERHLVELALDERLMLNGHQPIFTSAADEEAAAPTAEAGSPQAGQPKVGRNDPCPCGSGKKYKKCHGG